MDLRIIIRSEVGQTKININGIAYRWNLKKNYTSELIYKTKTDLQT